MNITAISDTHNDHRSLELGSGDILIHAGDACIKGSYTEGLDFLWWFVKQPYKYKVLVPGNHDNKIKSHPELISLAHDMGIHVLRDDLVEIEGLRIYGVCKVYMDKTRCNVADKYRFHSWKHIPENVDILVTHMPCHGILDANVNGVSIGCSELTKKVAEVKPKLHLFGHIHESAQQEVTIGATTYKNVAVKDRNYLTIYHEGYHFEQETN